MDIKQAQAEADAAKAAKAAEQEEVRQESELRGRSASLRFMMKHRDFKQCQKNAQTFQEVFGEARKDDPTLNWTEEVLAELFEKNKDRFELNVEPAKPAEEPKVEEDPASKFPWGTLTRQSIHDMPAAQYKTWYHDSELGAAFREQVNRISAGKSQFKPEVR